jgi:NAD(P)-dependent dehydrogenase (short-subunit alcohol dehydrogenase family)
MSLQRFSLQNRRVLITGASSGLGHGIAKGLAEAGAEIIACARREEKLHALVEEIRAAGGVAHAVAMDVADRSSVNAAYDRAEALSGTPDIIINNAGVADPKNFLKIDDASRDFVMGTNFNGVWNVAQEGAARMVAAGLQGSIINIASVLAIMAQSGQTTYCASKAAVAHLTQAMSLDLMRHGIRVNAIAPGWFLTEMNQDFFATDAGKAYIQRMPAKRLGNIDELVGPVILLASEAGSFINGTVLPVDGSIRHSG